jgi:hypothetical protein
MKGASVTVVQTFRSNLTSEIIPDDEVLTITMEYLDARKSKYQLHVKASEVENLISKADEVKKRRRGRPPKQRTEG